MSKLNYVDWDVLDTGGHYEFSPQEMIDIDYLNLTNFLLRGEGAVYTFNCDPSIPKGTTITVRNNEFGLDEGYYFGIQIILNPDSTAKRASYSFFFKDQIESFTFNGSFWMCNSPEPKAIAKMSFIKEDLEARGYLNIKEFQKDSQKNILFSNVDMNNFNTSIDNLFFQHGSLNDFGKITSKSHLEAHSHKADTHSHIFPIFKDKIVDVLSHSNTDFTLPGLFHLLDDLIGNWIEDKCQCCNEGKFCSDLCGTIQNLPECGMFLNYLNIKNPDTGKIGKSHDNFVYITNPKDEDGHVMPEYSMQNDLKSPVREVIVKHTGDDETRPKNIQGQYVIKCF